MQPPPPATPVPAPVAALDPTGQFAKRKKTSLWFTVSLLVVSVFILTIGLAATTRTENVTVGGYYPGIILVASIVFISFGVVAAFCCAIVDGVFAARHIDPRPLHSRRCQFYSSGIGFLYDAYQTEQAPLSQIAFSSTSPPQILYNPAQQILTYAGFCPSAAAIPAYPSYPLPLQPASHFPASSSTDISFSDDTQPPSQSSSSYGLPPNAPPLYTPTYFLPEEKPPPYAP